MNLENFYKPFCFKEKKKYKLFKYSNFKHKKFWKFPKKYNSNKYKTLIISGPARNGNHLLLSLLDGHSQISLQAGEDSFLTSVLSNVKKNEYKTINKIKKANHEFLLNLSGQYYFNQKIINKNKWKKYYDLSINNLIINEWSGSGVKNKIKGMRPSYIQDFKDYVVKLNYPKFEEKIISCLKFKNFFEFFYLYLSALKILNFSINYKIKYPFVLTGSGSRRELFFLLERSKNFKVLVPIRNFWGFYFSFAMSNFNTKQIKKKILDEAWQHWYKKVIDYLILQKKYPKNVFIISYEDLQHHTKLTVKKISKILDIKIENVIFKATVHKKNSKGNSSFENMKIKPGKIYKQNTKKKFNDKLLPKIYLEILDHIEKVKI